MCEGGGTHVIHALAFTPSHTDREEASSLPFAARGSMVDMDDGVDDGVDSAAEMESLDLGSATVNDCDKLVEGRRCDGGWGGGGGGGGGGTVDVTGVPRDANSVCRCLRGV